MTASEHRTGREAARGRRGICLSCQQRYMLGEPKASESWPAQLHLSAEQVDLLLIAAAEYRDLCEEAGEYETVVAFVDWLAPDVLGKTHSVIGEPLRPTG